MTRLHATETGRQVALSGLLPETADYLLRFLHSRGPRLSTMLPDAQGRGGDAKGFNFCVLDSCLTSPEFAGVSRTRFLHYGFEDFATNPLPDTYQGGLAEPSWQAYRGAANASSLILDWMDGAALASLEGRFRDLRAGNIQATCRDLNWCLSGFTNILAASTRPEIDDAERPAALRGASKELVADLRSLLPSIRLLAWRLDVGLPAAMLWWTEFRTADGKRAVSRREALALHACGVHSFEDLRQRNSWGDVVAALGKLGVSDANARSAELQKCANDYHKKTRDRFLERHRKAAGEDASIVERFYDSREKAFEKAFEQVLDLVKLKFTLFDDGKKAGAFDYLVHFNSRPDVVVECKSRQGYSMIGLNDAKVVLSSSELHGHGDKSCITVCQPGVSPDVPAQLQNAKRLCVVEAHDFAEAIIRLKRGVLAQEQIHDWLTQPGKATIDTLAAVALTKRAPDTPLEGLTPAS